MPKEPYSIESLLKEYQKKRNKLCELKEALETIQSYLEMSNKQERKIRWEEEHNETK